MKFDETQKTVRYDASEENLTRMRPALQSANTSSQTQCALLARRAATELKRNSLTANQRLNLCLKLLRGNVDDQQLVKFAQALDGLTIDHRHYWIGTFYTLLLPKEQRRRQSAYFTRPEIAYHLLRIIEDQGIDFRTARVLDPAAGGAAFLSMVAARMKQLGCSNSSILARIRGVEIDPILAKLSRLLIADRLGIDNVRPEVIAVGDALKTTIKQRYDLVLANPPYGRISPNAVNDLQWSAVCHPGHINLYALFVDHCLKLVKTGGRLGFVIPSSFIAGPLYCKLRVSIRERSHVKLIGHVESREEFFLDVLQDVSLLVLEHKAVQSKQVSCSASSTRVEFGRIDSRGKWIAAPFFELPETPSDGWILPAPRGTVRGGGTLNDFGCRVSAGYFVWNRETGRMGKRKARKPLRVPLFWACNIRANAVCAPNAKDGKGIDYVTFDEPSSAILHGPSILLQRTTNTKQRRRLIAGLVKNGPTIAHGYVSENHTIVVRPISKFTNLSLVCRLLNSEAVDRRYRQISGTASISTLLLRTLDLPRPENLLAAVEVHADFEAAVEHAYALGQHIKYKTA